MSPTLVLLYNVFAFPIVMTWIFSDGLRRYSIKGSYNRYRWATVQRTVKYPSAIGLGIYMLYAIAQISTGERLGWYIFILILDIWLAYCWHRDYKSLEDDDDFWTGKGKKLKSWLKSQFSVRVLSPVKSNV